MGEKERLLLDPRFRAAFPRLNEATLIETSRPTNKYNCIAWAAGESHRWWDPTRRYYWPPGVPRETDFRALVRAFKSLGYISCDMDASFEEGFEKVALYRSIDGDGKWKHAARQLPDGKWTSKLGQEIDIEHELRDLDGPEYGEVALVMKRVLE